MKTGERVHDDVSSIPCLLHITPRHACNKWIQYFILHQPFEFLSSKWPQYFNNDIKNGVHGYVLLMGSGLRSPIKSGKRRLELFIIFASHRPAHFDVKNAELIFVYKQLRP